MPNKGYVSITVPQNFYDDIVSNFEKNKKILNSLGIYSVSGFYAIILTAVLEDPELYNLTLRKIQSRIIAALKSLEKEND